MADPFASTAALAARWRPLSTEEVTRAVTLLGDASAIVRSEYPTIDDDLGADPPTLDATIPAMVVCAMVKRAMNSGDADGVASQFQMTGPFSSQRTYANPQGNLYLTKAERKMLGIGGQRAFSIDTAIDAGADYTSAACATEWS